MTSNSTAMTVPAHISRKFIGSDILSPAMQSRSVETKRSKSSARSDPTKAEVYNFDMEQDDRERLTTLQPILSELSRKPSNGRPEIILVAGQHVGGHDTFDELKEMTARLTGAMGGLTEVTKDRAEVGAVTVLRGAPLKRDTEEDRRLAREAGERVSSALGQRQYAWHNNTSAVLYASLVPDTQERCTTLSFTCGAVLGEEGPTTGANQFFDTDAHTEMVNACAEYSVPLDYVHGSLLGVSQRNLSDLPNWDGIFRNPVGEVQASALSDGGRLSLSKVAAWIGRYKGALSQHSGTAVSDEIRKLIDEQTEEKNPSDAILTSMKLWSKAACDPKTYSAHSCVLDGEFRAGRRAINICETLKYILNGSLGDLTAAASPDTVMYLPLKIDFGYTKKPGEQNEQDQKERPASITLDASNNAPLMAVSGNPQAAWESIVAKFEAGREWEKRFREDHGSAWTDPIEGNLAEEWEIFMPVASTLLIKTIDLASRRLSDEDLQKSLPEEQRIYEKEDYEQLCEALRNLMSEENTMTQVCREIRDSRGDV